MIITPVSTVPFGIIGLGAGADVGAEVVVVGLGVGFGFEEGVLTMDAFLEGSFVTCCDEPEPSMERGQKNGQKNQIAGRVSAVILA